MHLCVTSEHLNDASARWRYCSIDGRHAVPQETGYLTTNELSGWHNSDRLAESLSGELGFLGIQFGLPVTLVASGLAQSHSFSLAHVTVSLILKSLFSVLTAFKIEPALLTLAFSIMRDLENHFVGIVGLFCICLQAFLTLKRLWRAQGEDETPLPLTH